MEGDNITIVDEGAAREEKEAAEAQAEASIEIAKSSDEAACDIAQIQADAQIELAKIEAETAVEISENATEAATTAIQVEDDRWQNLMDRMDRLEGAVSALTMAETVELLTQQQSTAENQTESTAGVMEVTPDHTDMDTSQMEDQEKERHKESVVQEKIPLATKRIWI